MLLTSFTLQQTSFHLCEPSLDHLLRPFQGLLFPNKIQRLRLNWNRSRLHPECSDFHHPSCSFPSLSMKNLKAEFERNNLVINSK